MTTKLFRQLILAWWLLTLIGVVVDWATRRYLPPELTSYLDSVANAEPTPLDWLAFAFGFILALLIVVASIGLYRFKRWGRTLYLWVHVLSLITSPLFGFVLIASQWASVAYYLYAILTGGILFTMYLPPIATYFDEDPFVAESDKV